MYGQEVTRLPSTSKWYHEISGSNLVWLWETCPISPAPAVSLRFSLESLPVPSIRRGCWQQPPGLHPLSQGQRAVGISQDPPPPAGVRLEWMHPGLPSPSSTLLPVGWMARSCRPRTGGSPNPSMAISSQCPLTPRTPGQPVGLEMAWWGLFRAVENLLESRTANQEGGKRCPQRTTWLSQCPPHTSQPVAP